MTFKYWTRNDIDNLLRSNDKAVERAIVRLFELQNADEQRQGTTNVQNGRGFCSSDARAGTRFARWIQGMDNKNVVRYAPKSLNNPRARNIFYRYCAPNGTVMDRARKIALKHSKQLVEIANEKANKPSGLIETVTPVGKPKKAQFQMTQAEKDEMNRQTRERLGAGWETTEEEIFGTNPAARTTVYISAEPQPGTLAATARIMASTDDSGYDWDAWKDQMKDKMLGL